MKSQIQARTLAVYLRTSLEDYGKSHRLLDQSCSILNQRKVIEDYLAGHEDIRALRPVEYIDDGFTGTNTDRPRFRDMVHDVEAGRVGCVIVKDLSRFGRNYLEVGEYLERVFPACGVRLIAVNDHYDSGEFAGTTGGLDVTFRNFIYESYSKDLSVKVRSAMRTRMEKGKFVNHTPYGYLRDAQDKHRMVPDPQTAPIVREIFRLILSGRSTTETARLLNERGVPTPLQYKQHRLRISCQNRELLWSHTMVLNILHNVKYTGTMVTHTRESRYLRDNSQRRTAPDEWIVVEDTHEALVSRADYERANAMLRHPKKAKTPAEEAVDNVFFCGQCGRKLQKTHGNDIYFSCCTHKYVEAASCKGLKWSKTELEAVIVPAYRAQLAVLGQRRAAEEPAQNRVSVFVRRMAQLERETAEADRRRMQLFEQYHDGTLSLDAYLEQKAALNERRKKLQRDREEIEAGCQDERERNEQRGRTRKRIEDYLANGAEEGEAFLREMYRAIDRVDVMDARQLSIRWKFDDIFRDVPPAEE